MISDLSPEIPGCAHCTTPRVATSQVETYAEIALIRLEHARENSQFYAEPYEAR
jgi:hypothetical protein